ncbi:hypothetical protein AKO1_011182 [Acrasis kona]|uniref:Coatomer subunit zeta n=1 Tax=Acrasis kona TaxID=1008807 RepID=A0AAW2YZ55_9EUKA
MLDGFIILERGTNRIVFTRRTPTYLAQLTNQLKNGEEMINDITSPTSLLQQSSFKEVSNSRKRTTSSVLANANQPMKNTQQSDYSNNNISWANVIIDYMNRVQQGSVPSVDGEFRVFTFVNDRFIVFTAVGALIFVVVGDCESSELGLRETCKTLIEGCKSVCKRVPDDSETIAKNYNKVCTIADDMFATDGLGFGFNSEKLSKHINDLTE